MNPPIFYVLPLSMFGVVAFMMALVGSPLDAAGDALGIAALAGMIGISVGYLVFDRMYPDGWHGFGRIAAIWLGLAIMMPAALLNGHQQVGNNQGVYGGFFAMAAVWVMGSSTIFADLYLLTARQTIRFALYFYGASTLAFGLFAFCSPDVAGIVGAVILFGGWPLATYFNKRIRVPFPVTTVTAPLPANDDFDLGSSGYAPALNKSLPDDAAEPAVHPLPAIPEQTSSGSSMLFRWAMSAVLDYLILTVIFAALLWGWPGKEHVVEAFGGMFAVWLLYHPLCEGLFGGTLGQHFLKIRLVAPGRGSALSAHVVFRRHFLRIVIFWGLIMAVVYWIKWVRIGPEERTRIAQGTDEQGLWEWIFIDG